MANIRNVVFYPEIADLQLLTLTKGPITFFGSYGEIIMNEILKKAKADLWNENPDFLRAVFNLYEASTKSENYTLRSFESLLSSLRTVSQQINISDTDQKTLATALIHIENMIVSKVADATKKHILMSELLVEKEWIDAYQGLDLAVKTAVATIQKLIKNDAFMRVDLLKEILFLMKDSACADILSADGDLEEVVVRTLILNYSHRDRLLALMANAPDDIKTKLKSCDGVFVSLKDFILRMPGVASIKEYRQIFSQKLLQVHQEAELNFISVLAAFPRNKVKKGSSKKASNESFVSQLKALMRDISGDLSTLNMAAIEIPSSSTLGRFRSSSHAASTKHKQMAAAFNPVNHLSINKPANNEMGFFAKVVKQLKNNAESKFSAGNDVIIHRAAAKKKKKSTKADNLSTSVQVIQAIQSINSECKQPKHSRHHSQSVKVAKHIPVQLDSTLKTQEINSITRKGAFHYSQQSIDIANQAGAAGKPLSAIIEGENEVTPMSRKING
ncbi:MAG TPA: hypothetical protein VHA13_04620 [Gammaproteobacteria bacterium]|nr:hypothetical protein [Gammaproteobacteria bacterium]